SAARMGTRHMVSYPTVPEDPELFATADDEITYIITTAMPFLDWERAEITIFPAVDARTPGIQMSVQIVYPLDLPTIEIPYIVRPGSLVLLPPITLNAVSTMRLD